MNPASIILKRLRPGLLGFSVVGLFLLGESATMSPAAAVEPLAQLGSNVAPAVGHSTRIATLDDRQHVNVQLALNLRDSGGLQALIRSVSTPGSPDYGHYLTPRQFANRFGPTPEQVDSAVAYLRGSGLQVQSFATGGLLVNASGSAAEVSRAMHTGLSRYVDRADGREFYANDSAPTLPSHIASMVQAVHGLDNHAIRHSYAIPRTCCALAPYSPSQVRAGYNFNAAPLSGLTGTGQTIGLLELNTFQQANVDNFDTTYNLTPPAPQVLTVPDGGHTVSSLNGGAQEVELDIEVIQGIAPGAQVMVFEAPNFSSGINNAYACMEDPNALGTSPGTRCPNEVSGITAPASSTSWGLCEADQGPIETQTLHNIFSAAAAVGHTLYAASGDSGTNDNCSATPAVDSPASDPNVTGTGGTKLSLDRATNSWSAEVAWPAEPRTNLGSGGGLSKVFSQPSWQVGLAVQNSYSNGMRQVPDVAANADPVTGFAIYTCTDSSLSMPQPPCNPSWGGFGGTSAAAPAWAAWTAIYNQYAASQAKPNLGFANPLLYTAAICPLGHQPLHDIKQGSNPSNAPFVAGPGWDYLTGLGSYNASELAQTAAALGSVGVTINSVDQTRGSGGQTINVVGCGFQQTPTVTFGGVPSPQVTWLSSTSLAVVTPQHAPTSGALTVQVTNPDTSSSQLANAFHYVRSPSHQRIATNVGGRLEAFVTGGDGNLYHSWEGAPSGPFGGLSSLGAPVSVTFVNDPAVGVNADGRLETFVIGSDNLLWHSWQTAAGSGWTTFYPVGSSPPPGGLQGNAAVSTNNDGRLEIFARAVDNSVWHAWQGAPNAGWGAWSRLGGSGDLFVSDVTVGRNGDGRLEIAAVSATGILWHAWQTAPSSGWSNFYSLTGRAIAGTPGINTNRDGRLEIFAQAGDDRSLVHIFQAAPSSGWGTWSSLGGRLGTDPSVSRNPDGRLEIFAIDLSGSLIHMWQLAPNSGWGGIFSLGQPSAPLVGSAQAAEYADGRVQVMAQDLSPGRLWQIVQAAPGAGWTSFSSLGGPALLAY